MTKSISSPPSFPVEKLFPKVKYNEACRTNKKLIPIYLIALNQPTQTIIEQLELRKSASYEEPEFKLTALAVAVMMRNYDIIKYLLQQEGTSPLAMDKAEFTPIHYAYILGDEKSLALLKEKTNNIALKKFKDFYGWEMILNPKFPNSEERVIDILESNGLRSLTAAEFKHKTGANFYNGVFGNQSSAMDLCVQRLHESLDPRGPLNNFMLTQFKKYSLKPPLIYMGPQGSSGYGIFAGQQLKKNEICALYGGEIFAGELTGLGSNFTEYYFPGFNALDYRNAGSMVNDSFPNAGFYPLYLEDGTKLFVLVPFREIEKGEGIYIDYVAGHRIKHLRHEELNIEEMETFFQKNSLVKLKQSVLVKKSRANNSLHLLETTTEMSRLIYIYHTPSALLHLFLKNILVSNEIKILFEFLLQHSFFGGSTTLIETSIEFIEKIDMYFRACSSHQKNECIKMIDYLIQNYMFKGVLEAVLSHIEAKADWKRETLDLIAEAAEQFEYMVTDLTTMDEKVAALKKFTKNLMGLPDELKSRLVRLTLVLTQSKPKLAAVFRQYMQELREK